jgi:hypothetical protein
MHYESINYQDMLRVVESSHDGANKGLCKIHIGNSKQESLVAMQEKLARAQVENAVSGLTTVARTTKYRSQEVLVAPIFHLRQRLCRRSEYEDSDSSAVRYHHFTKGQRPKQVQKKGLGALWR